MKKLITVIFLITMILTFSAFSNETANQHKKLGDTYLLKKDYDAAIAEYKIALQFDPMLSTELKPKIALCYSSKGVEKSKNKMWADAEDAFRKSLEYSPNQPTIYYNLGVVLEKQNKISEARKAYEKFLTFHDAEKGLVAVVEEKLKTLGTSSTSETADHYIRGLELMTENRFPEAKAEFLLVEGENKEKAQEMIKSIENIEKLSTSPGPVSTGSEEDKVKNAVLTLGLGFEKKDINIIKTLYSHSASNSIGGFDEIINYYNDFWFTYFDSLKFKVTEINSTVQDKDAILTCNIEMEGTYTGPDFSKINPKFTPGSTYKISGPRQFILIKENNFWYILN